jgi:benzoyl-CoA reductase/2-hydroxyglutaryl-CoA dehydratase subunit BcrC/BadD/HgdB
MTGSVKPMDLHWMYHLYHVARPAPLEDFFSSLLSERISEAPSRRIALAGSPLSLEDTTVIEVLQKGGFGVLPLHCAALQSVPSTDPPGEPVSGGVRELAGLAFRSVRCARSRPNDDMFGYISELIDHTGCEGLVVKTMRFCDLWFTERERFREKMNIPVLVLDTAFSSGERERQMARLEAFMETLA